jgi:hypothetical protein
MKYNRGKKLSEDLDSGVAIGMNFSFELGPLFIPAPDAFAITFYENMWGAQIAPPDLKLSLASLNRASRRVLEPAALDVFAIPSRSINLFH